MLWMTHPGNPYDAPSTEGPPMHPKTIDAAPRLMLAFLRWVDERPRLYAETMEAWRTSCPRISVWEDALIEGLIEAETDPGSAQGEVRIVLTETGRACLPPV